MKLHRLLLSVLTLSLVGCAHTPPDEPSDPLEPFNRAMFSFNLTADKYLLRPVAKGYDAVAPNFVRQGVSNFFRNLGEPRTVINDVLQGKLLQASSDTGRFLLNTTAGFVGVLDVATNAGLPRHQEDFGQTIGSYGIGQGWYLMLPLLGPTTNRDLIGRGADYFATVTSYTENEVAYPLTGAELVNQRAYLLPADSLLDDALDKYVFVRTAYLQQRLNKVYEGSPPHKLLYGDDAE